MQPIINTAKNNYTQLSICIPTYNRLDCLENCLESINKDFKVIIVENSNNINFKNKVEKKFSNVECFLAGENLGYGKANNEIIKICKTKYLLILNPDTVLNKNIQHQINPKKVQAKMLLIVFFAHNYTKYFLEHYM